MMNENKTYDEEKIVSFIQSVLDYRESGSGEAGKKGPEYWADTPWRLDPIQNEIPLTFIIRDAKGERLALV